MKFRDLELSPEQVMELIKKKSPRYYEEFLSKGIILYRGGRSQDDIRIIRPNKIRKPLGWVIKHNNTAVFDSILNNADVATRFSNYPVFTMSNTTITDIMVDEMYYFIPIGNDYKYSYLSSLDNDFNNISTIDRNKIRELETLIDIIRRTYGISVDVNKYILDIINNSSVAKSRKQLLTDMGKSENITQADKDFIIDNGLVNVRKQFSKNNMNKKYITNDSNKLKNAKAEVWFNTKSYMLVPLFYRLKDYL